MAEKSPRLALLWADAAYTGRFRSWVREERGWRVEVPRHPDWQLWRYGLWRRNRAACRCCLKEVGGGEDIRVAGASAEALAKDCERLPQTAVVMIYWAMSRIMQIGRAHV